MNIKTTGMGEVKLLAGGGKVFTDIAARFCHSERNIDDICDSPYSAKIVKNILDSGHLAATEFDYFIFAIQGYSRVTEVQLVRKRIGASYLISSGRDERGGKREFNVVLPENVKNFNGTHDVLCRLEELYETMIANGIPEEDARYIKPQATEFKAIIGMNAHALLDWFGIRCCLNAQSEIRDLANKMLALCKEVSPDLFANAGARCIGLGYCPENDRQNPKCHKIRKDEALKILKERTWK